MSSTKTIALLTDFGLQDGYVGIMKGIIASVNPHLTTIDISHKIPPQHILAGRFCLMNAYQYFPQDTVFIVVVDPGVGSQRRGVAIQFSQGYLVGPNNGLFSGVLSQNPAIAAVSLTNTNYWRISHPSATFHGRDIFAPVGAHLASGVPLENLGEAIAIDSLIDCPINSPQTTEKGIQGTIQSIDHFGNIITNISANQVVGKNWSVLINDQTIQSGLIYSDRKIGEIITLIGSHGWVEIAVNGGSAEQRLKAQWRDKVIIIFE